MRITGEFIIRKDRGWEVERGHPSWPFNSILIMVSEMVDQSLGGDALFICRKHTQTRNGRDRHTPFVRPTWPRTYADGLRAWTYPTGSVTDRMVHIYLLSRGCPLLSAAKKCSSLWLRDCTVVHCFLAYQADVVYKKKSIWKSQSTREGGTESQRVSVRSIFDFPSARHPGVSAITE